MDPVRRVALGCRTAQAGSVLGAACFFPLAESPLAFSEHGLHRIVLSVLGKADVGQTDARADFVRRVS